MVRLAIGAGLPRCGAPPAPGIAARMDLAAFQEQLRPAGLNLFAVADVAAWDAQAPPSRQSAALLPGARSILVVASGGRALWEALLADLRAEPAHLREERHPVDAFVRRRVLAADAAQPGTRRWFWAAAEAELHLDFRLLAALAGLGHHSRLGLVLHPVYGPWLGLRAACFTDAVLPPTPLSGPNPCDTCAARPGGPPCTAACPGDAFPDGRWEVDPCTRFHGESARCAASCAAREACPEGAAHRYDPEQIAYHYDRLGGRRRLRVLTGILDDPHEGDGPHWGNWRRRVNVGTVDVRRESE